MNKAIQVHNIGNTVVKGTKFVQKRPYLSMHGLKHYIVSRVNVALAQIVV